MGYSWEAALAAVFIEGLIFVLLTALNIREQIVKCIPKNLRFAISGGLGLFIAFIGLKNAGLVVANDATFVTLGTVAIGLAIQVAIMVRIVKSGGLNENFKILDNINFILRPGDKTALIGQNDIQTTALIRALMGDIEYEGTVKWGVTTSQSYLPKDNSRDFASGESILDWLRQFASKEEDDNTFLRGFLGRMLFSGDEVNKSVNVLSGGEKVRVMLSKLMLLKSNVLVLDDPTNHLDLESISSLNDGLKNFKGSIIFASHDHEFIQTLANHIIVLSKNGVIDRIDETYDEFLENQEVQAKVKELWKD